MYTLNRSQRNNHSVNSW